MTGFPPKTLYRTGALAVVIVGALLPAMVGSGALPLGELEYTLSLAMMAVGMNVVFGLAGQLFLAPPLSSQLAAI